jgi:hypothetical protein
LVGKSYTQVCEKLNINVIDSLNCNL